MGAKRQGRELLHALADIQKPLETYAACIQMTRAS